MAFRFSPNTGGFYIEGVHQTIPADCVTVSEDAHHALMAAQAEGATITVGQGGAPVAVFPAAPNLAQRREAAIVTAKREAERRILAIAPLWRQSNDAAAIAQAALQMAALGHSSIDTGDAVDRRQRIDAIRDASNLLEAAIADMNAANLAVLDIANDAHWPGEPA